MATTGSPTVRLPESPIWIGVRPGTFDGSILSSATSLEVSVPTTLPVSVMVDLPVALKTTETLWAGTPDEPVSPVSKSTTTCALVRM